MSGPDAQIMCRRTRSLNRVRAVPRFVSGCMKLRSAGGPARKAYLAILLLGVISIFAMTLALLIMGQSRPWSDRYLFLAFNGLHCEHHYRRGNTLNSLRAVTFRTSLEGRSTRSVGRESLGLKRSVRVQAVEQYLDCELAVSDYLMKEPGMWAGRGAERLGLRGSVERSQFVALLRNENPATGKRLTARRNTSRQENGETVSNRAGWLWARVRCSQVAQRLPGDHT